VVVLLNADAWLERAFLRAALTQLADPSVAAVQGKVLRPPDAIGDIVRIDSAGLVALKSRRVVGRGQHETDDRYGSVAEIFGADGAVAVLRRVALDDLALPSGSDGEVEYLDESFFAYKEDVDLAWRLRLRGWRTMYEPSAIAWHLRGARERPLTGFVTRLRDRRDLPATASYLGFTNHRLMQLKNERLAELLPDIGPFLLREIAAWGMQSLQRGSIWRPAARLARLAPSMLRKRRIVQRRRSPGVSVRDWFVSQDQLHTAANE